MMLSIFHVPLGHLYINISLEKCLDLLPVFRLGYLLFLFELHELFVYF